MSERRFQDIWKEQCAVGRGVRDKHGVVSALDYLIGEKLMTFADAAATRPEFARELPRFVAEVRAIFAPEEIRAYLDHMERMEKQDDDAAELGPDDIDFETPEQKNERQARFANLKELLNASALGTA